MVKDVFIKNNSQLSLCMSCSVVGYIVSACLNGVYATPKWTQNLFYSDAGKKIAVMRVYRKHEEDAWGLSKMEY